MCNLRGLVLGAVFIISSVISIAAVYMQTPDRDLVPDELLVKFAEGTSLSRIQEIGDEVGASLEEKMAVGEPDLYRVKVPTGSLDAGVAAFARHPEVIGVMKIPTPIGREIDEIAVPNELLVKFKPNTPQSRIDEANNQNNARSVKRILGDPDVHLIVLPANANLDDAIRRYRQHPNVAWVNKNSRVFPH